MFYIYFLESVTTSDWLREELIAINKDIGGFLCCRLGHLGTPNPLQLVRVSVTSFPITFLLVPIRAGSKTRGRWPKDSDPRTQPRQVQPFGKCVSVSLTPFSNT